MVLFQCRNSCSTNEISGRKGGVKVGHLNTLIKTSLFEQHFGLIPTSLVICLPQKPEKISSFHSTALLCPTVTIPKF